MAKESNLVKHLIRAPSSVESGRFGDGTPFDPEGQLAVAPEAPGPTLAADMHELGTVPVMAPMEFGGERPKTRQRTRWPPARRPGVGTTWATGSRLRWPHPITPATHPETPTSPPPVFQ